MQTIKDLFIVLVVLFGLFIVACAVVGVVGGMSLGTILLIILLFGALSNQNKPTPPSSSIYDAQLRSDLEEFSRITRETSALLEEERVLRNARLYIPEKWLTGEDS